MAVDKHIGLDAHAFADGALGGKATAIYLRLDAFDDNSPPIRHVTIPRALSSICGNVRGRPSAIASAWSKATGKRAKISLSDSAWPFAVMCACTVSPVKRLDQRKPARGGSRSSLPAHKSVNSAKLAPYSASNRGTTATTH